ncbi:dioxygenase (plasmid) [Rhizobium sp. CB3060]|uniref:DODA-type extradiol aromatic ring-opening family dioxygenase n=1 Tax=Rhizobium sp. CB3060 TaxID=3138255 RepID=UPI0021A541ED|nr:class III extradiol ring-cleavage dioxygenase [Rhizobium tropici]UWU26048.1 dioxygenase [Rhizobium tropici]
MTDLRLPTYFISHGGGPWPYMTGEFRRNFDQLEKSLIDTRIELADKPTAILVISGHWEEEGFAISSGTKPGMLFDYHGFPDDLYRIAYTAPGSPELAARVRDLLRLIGVDAALDPTRGYDHGTFSIMKPLYPEEDIPVVQLSLDTSYDPALHLNVGRALAPLRDEGVLLIGSGLSYHNLSAMFDNSGAVASRRFDAWLHETLVRCPTDTRTERLIGWEKAPAARAAHPREDHLIPLMVVVGAAEEEPGATIYHQKDLFGGLTASSFRFGPLPSANPTNREIQ